MSLLKRVSQYYWYWPCVTYHFVGGTYTWFVVTLFFRGHTRAICITTTVVTNAVNAYHVSAGGVEWRPLQAMPYVA